MNRMDRNQPGVPSAISHETARCTTRTDSFDARLEAGSEPAKFAHLPVKVVMEDTVPKCMGVELHSNSNILNAKAWTVEKHINLGKVALYVGKNILNSTKEKFGDAMVNLASYLIGDDAYVENQSSFLYSQLATRFADEMLTMLHMVTDLRNIEGTEADWKEHMECINKGKKNPRWPKNPLLNQFTKKAHECEELQDRLSALVDKGFDRLRQSEFDRMYDMERELVQKAVELYTETLENLEAMTNFTVEEILDEAYSIRRDFYTEESMTKPESEWELREMTLAEGNGFPDRNKLTAYLNSDLTTLVPDVVDKVRLKHPKDELLMATSDVSLMGALDDQLRHAGIRVSTPQVNVDLTDIKARPRQDSCGSVTTDSGVVSDYRSDSSDADAFSDTEDL